MTKCMAMELKHGQMAASMKVISIEAESMVREDTSGLMVANTLGIGYKVLSLASVEHIGMMGEYTMESG
jgi:hypothetical protein